MFAMVPLPLRAQDGVLARDIVLKDERRGRAIECRVYAPEQGEKLPLILFSHGFGADKTAFELVSRHVAARGYVVVHPSHQDGVGKSAGRPGGMDRESLLRQIRERGGLAAMLSDQSRVEGRIADLLFVMDHPEKLSAAVPELADRLDASRIGVGGHSFGAFTASLLGGVTVDLGGQRARSFKDKRVKCILPISGQGTGQQGLTAESWKQLTLPMMTITGSRDRGAGGQGPEWKMEPYRLSPPGDKYLVFIEGANHVSFGGYRGVANEFTPAVQQASVLFWDAYLKDDPAAIKALKDKILEQSFPGRVRQEWK
jgi:predicted dienelactone hydrolase